MKFPVDLLADVSHAELERLAHSYMTSLLYSNPDCPEHLTLSDSSQVTIDISSVGFVPLYGSSDKQKILALFSPADPFTAVALYLLDRWWAVDDIIKTADPARDGAVEVETVGERIVLYILNRVIYRAKEMSSEELPFLCHGEKDYAKILWNNGEAVGFYSVKPSGSICNSFSTRSYQLPVMDSIFVRKCQRGKGFGLQMLEDFVLSFKEDCLGLRYPITKSMYKVCEKYLCQYPGDTGLLWEVESIGGPNQRTNIASKIQAMDQNAVSKSLSFTEESIVITEMTEKDVVTTQIREAESVECTVEIVEEVTVLGATLEAEVPLTARGRSSGSKRRKMGEKIAEDKSEKVLRIEDIEAETPREEQDSAQQETELHSVSELVQPEGMIGVAPEEKGRDVVDAAAEKAATMSDQAATVLAPQDPEEADVTSAPVTEDPQAEDDASNDLNNTSRDSQITVENVASEIEAAEEEYQKEHPAVLVVSEDILKEAETLNNMGEGTQIGDTNEKSEERVAQHEISLLKRGMLKDGEAGRTGRGRTVKAIKTVQSRTPRRRSERHRKLEEGVEEETAAQDGGIILRGRTVMNTPTPKRKYTRHSQKVCEDLEIEVNEVAEERDVSTAEVVEELAAPQGKEEEMASIKGDLVAVEELTEEQLEDEQMTIEEETEKRQQPGMEDTVGRGSSTELPDTAEATLTKENEDENVPDEFEKEQKGEEVETSVIQDKQDVSDDETEEPPVVQKRALRGRRKVPPKPEATKRSKRHQKQEEEHTDEADLGAGGSASEEHHREEQQETADQTEEKISTEDLTVVEDTVPKAEDAVPSTEVTVEESKEVQEEEDRQGETKNILVMEAEKEEAVRVVRMGRRSAAATARRKSKRIRTECQTEEEGEEESTPAEETGGEEEEAGQESLEEKVEEAEEEGKSLEIEKDKDVQEEEAESAAGGGSAEADEEQMEDASTEEVAVLEEQDNSVEAVDETGTDTAQILSAEVEETNSAEEEETTVIEKSAAAATEEGSGIAVTEEEASVEDASVVVEEEAPAQTTRALKRKIKTSQATPSRRSTRQKDQEVVETQQQEEENPEEEEVHQLTDDSPRRSVRERPRVDYREQEEADGLGETEAVTYKEEEDEVESDEDKVNKKAKCSADEPKEKLDILNLVLDTDGEVDTAGKSQEDEEDKQNSSEEEGEPIVMGKRVLRGRSVPSIIITPQSKTRRRSAKVQKAEESLTDEEKSPRSALEEENTEPEAEMEKVEAVAGESLMEQEAVEEEQSAVSETRADGQKAASVGESAEETPSRYEREVTDEEAPTVETRVLRSGEKTVRATIRGITTNRQDDEQEEEAAGEKSTEEDEPAVETGVVRKGRKSAAGTARRKSKRVHTECQTEEEGEEETTPAEETGGEEEEAGQELLEEKAEKAEEEGKSLEKEKDKDVQEEEAESAARGESAEGDAEQMEDTLTEEAAVLEEQDNSVEVVDETGTDTAQILSAEVEETNSAEEEETTVIEKSAAAKEEGSDTASVTGVADDAIQEPCTVAAAPETAILDTVLSEAAVPTTEKPQGKDSGSEIPKLQKATVILVDIKTACHHLSVKDTEETPVDGECAAPEKQQEEENGGKQENITGNSVDATAEAETVLKGELEEEEESATVHEEKSEAEEALVSETRVLRSGGKAVKASCKSTSSSNQQKDEDNTAEDVNEKELNEAGPGTDEVKGEMETVAKDAVTVEQKQPAVSEISADREAVIPVGDGAEENLPPAEVDEAMNLEEEEALVVETRALRHGTKTSIATPRRKTRSRKQVGAREAENAEEEEPAVTARILRHGRISASDTPKGKSRRSRKHIQEEEQRVEQQSESVEETGVEEEKAANETAVEQVQKEAASDKEERLEPEIDMEEGEAVAEQGQDVVEEQSEGIAKTVAEREEEALGEVCDEGKPVMGGKEVEPQPVPVTRSLRSGRKMSKPPPKTRISRRKKQQDEEEEGGASAEKSTDGNELPEETRILRRGRKSVGRSHKQLQKDEEGLKEPAEKEEEAGLGSAEEPPTEGGEGKAPDQEKLEVENEELSTVEVEKGVSEEGTMAVTEEEGNTAVGTVAADDLLQVGETDTPLPKPITDSTVLPPSEEEATPSAEEQQSEEKAPELSDLQRVTVVLVDLQKTHHDVQEEAAAAEDGLLLQKTAAEAEEEQREEQEKMTVLEEGFEDKVEAVAIQDSGEGRAQVAAQEEEAKRINDEEQEPTVTETRTCRSRKQAVKTTPRTKLTRSRQKKGDVEKEDSSETVAGEDTEASVGQPAEEGKTSDVAEEAVTTQDTVEVEQSTSTSEAVESAAGESAQETLLTANDDEAKDVSDEEEAPTVKTRVLRSGEKTVRATIRGITTNRQDEEQEEEAAGEKSTEEDEPAVETGVVRKGRKSAAATARRKSKRIRTEYQTEEGEEETIPAEETGGEEEEAGQESLEEKAEEAEEEGKSLEIEKDKDVQEEEAESAAGGESAEGDAEQMEDASTEEVAVLEEQDNSVETVDETGPDTAQILSAEVEETNSAEEEETTVIEKSAAATKEGSGIAVTEEEASVEDASVVAEEEAPARTTRALKRKIKTSHATPSRRSTRQKDQEVVETQQQEEENPEEEEVHQLTDDSPRRSVRKRPRVDYREQEEADGLGETEAVTYKEEQDEVESDEDRVNKKAQCSADEPKEKLDTLNLVLDTDGEVDTAGKSQEDEEDEQNSSEEEGEPIVIGKRVLRGRSVPSIIITPQSKSRRRSAKVQKAEESLTDEEKSPRSAQKRKSTEVTPIRKSKRLSRV